MPDYLVQYGTAAFVGRFTADNDLSRGASVVVRSPRGLEIGCVLCETKSAFDLGGCNKPTTSGRPIRLQVSQ